MSKKLIWPITISILFCLCGCGGEESIGETVSQETAPQEVNVSSDAEMPDTSEPFLAFEEQWQDNTLDLYIGQVNHSLKPEQPEGARDGGGFGTCWGTPGRQYLKSIFLLLLRKAGTV